jgi:hypothetical protein
VVIGYYAADAPLLRSRELLELRAMRRELEELEHAAAILSRYRLWLVGAAEDRRKELTRARVHLPVPCVVCGVLTAVVVEVATDITPGCTVCPAHPKENRP